MPTASLQNFTLESTTQEKVNQSLDEICQIDIKKSLLKSAYFLITAAFLMATELTHSFHYIAVEEEQNVDDESDESEEEDEEPATSSSKDDG